MAKFKVIVSDPEEGTSKIVEQQRFRSGARYDPREDFVREGPSKTAD